MIIATSEYDDAVETIPTGFQKFILGGIQAVKNSPSSKHDSILADLASALNCPKEALEFLLVTNPDTQNADLDFPDAERRRHIAAENHLMIAQ